MGKIVFVLIGERKGKLSYLEVYNSRQEAEVRKEGFEAYDTKNKDEYWKYKILEERVRD